MRLSKAELRLAALCVDTVSRVVRPEERAAYIYVRDKLGWTEPRPKGDPRQLELPLEPVQGPEAVVPGLMLGRLQP